MSQSLIYMCVCVSSGECIKIHNIRSTAITNCSTQLRTATKQFFHKHGIVEGKAAEEKKNKLSKVTELQYFLLHTSTRTNMHIVQKIPVPSFSKKKHMGRRVCLHILYTTRQSVLEMIIRKLIKFQCIK